MNHAIWLPKTLPFFLVFQLVFSFDAITTQQSLRDGEVIVSSGNMFALGFFSSKSNLRYVGIWYYQVTEQTVVWVANRENPINDTSGILSIDSGSGNLVLHAYGGGNQTDPVLVWSTNASVTIAHPSTNCVAQLYDSGNLVLAQNGTPLWQSFDYPTNTVVSFMKLGVNLTSGFNRFLTSWKSANDPGTGNYSYKIDPGGLPQLVLYKGSTKVWRAGSWTGERWSGVPEMIRPYLTFNRSYVSNNEEITIEIEVGDPSTIARIVANETGIMQRYTWNAGEQRWFAMWEAPNEDCDSYGQCGPNSNCDGTRAAQLMCSCFPGFEPKSPQNWMLRDWSDGCIRKPNASICEAGEGFVKLVRVKLPDTSAAHVDMSLGLKLCQDQCLRNCSCMAYASAMYETSNGGTGCVTWHGDMVDTRTYTDAGQDLYVRVDAVDLAHYWNKGTLGKKRIILIVSGALLFFLAVFAFYLLRKTRGRHRRPYKSSLSFIAGSTRFEEPLNERKAELPLFDLGTIASATNNFSSDNKLGQGGFGPVYKGTLNGKEIAVKRLSKSSGQGIQEFKNEITLIANLQHRNLVRILGCCIDKEEKMLIYEYLPNKSLDSFIFDERKRAVLVWEKRYEIICGIARGIVYLHQDSRLRIIHRDLKASNILLDAEMNPKISDFGMARIFRGDQIEANTNRVVGTYGYMAPEYAMQGHFSTKSDVYSFGVLILEIITGRRNCGHYPDSPTSNLIGHVWELWRHGKAIEIMDSSLGGCHPAAAEVLRCIQIGLLCVQDSSTDRPNMSAVVAMLGNDASLPSPKQPAFIINKTNETCNNEGCVSSNEATLTMPQPR